MTETQQPATVTPIKRTRKAPSAATRKAAATAKPAASKPAPGKTLKEFKVSGKGVTKSAANRIALSALEKAAGALIASWDEKSTGVSRDLARELISHRLSYNPAGTDWDPRLSPRTVLGSRTKK